MEAICRGNVPELPESGRRLGTTWHDLARRRHRKVIRYGKRKSAIEKEKWARLNVKM
jgi:hypothetical protein